MAEIPTTVITLTESPVLTLSPSSVIKTKLRNKNSKISGLRSNLAGCLSGCHHSQFRTLSQFLQKLSYTTFQHQHLRNVQLLIFIHHNDFLCPCLRQIMKPSRQFSPVLVSDDVTTLTMNCFFGTFNIK